jgi:hypothetical protein
LKKGSTFKVELKCVIEEGVEMVGRLGLDFMKSNKGEVLLP